MTDLDMDIEKQQAVIAGPDVKVCEAEEALDDAFTELHGALDDLGSPNETQAQERTQEGTMFYVGTTKYAYILRGRSDASSLEGAIEKWQFIVDWLLDNPGKTLLDDASRTCELCHEYGTYSNLSDGKRWACNGCPVANFTGYADCRGTPYDLYHDNPSLDNAMLELEFLQALREVQ